MIQITPAIITSFKYYVAGYSLMNLVRSQIRQLKRAHYDANLVVCTSFKEDDSREFSEATIHRILPEGDIGNYSNDELEPRHYELVADSAQILIEFIDKHGINIVLTHDIVFLGTHFPYALAVREASRQRPDVKWMHWIHSVPTGFNPIWDIKKYGPNHKLVFPNQTDALRVGEQFRGGIEDVIPIHHVKDIREFARFGEPTWRFIDQYDLMSADVVQIYPASVDRLQAKGINYLIKIFGAMKTVFDKNVKLVICNQWCNVDKHRKTVEQTLERGKQYGLLPDRDLIFSSRFEAPDWELGVPEKMVAELMMLANLFIFPTREESFGLVLPEASLMGGCLIVANGSLDMMREITGNHALFWDFGSFHRDYRHDDEDMYFRGIAQIILGKMQSESAVRHKTFIRQRYNLDSNFKQELEPAMMALLNENS